MTFPDSCNFKEYVLDQGCFQSNERCYSSFRGMVSQLTWTTKELEELYHAYNVIETNLLNGSSISKRFRTNWLD